MSDDNTWKVWAAIALCVLSIGFAVRRVESTFGLRPPDWMQLREHTSPRIEGVFGTSPAWHHFQDLARAARVQADIQCATDYSVQLVEFERGGDRAVVWSGETVHNQGFDPLSKIERMLWIELSRVIGFYAADGTPLGFATRRNPRTGNQLFITVHLDNSIAPGAAVFLIRREGAAHLPPTGSASERIMRLGYLRRTPELVAAQGVVLPPRATPKRYAPAESAMVVPGPATMVAWISSDMKDNGALLSVTFSPH